MTDREKERLEYLKRELFALEMKDRWDSADHSYRNMLKKEIKELEAKEC